MLSCLDQSGLPVDSWVSLAQNEDYFYYWHDGPRGFLKSVHNLTQTSEGNIMATVNQLYSADLDLDNVAWSLYNDDPPPPEDTASSTYAHAKGVLLTDSQQGFWLVHSKPNWPGSRETGAIPFPDTQYSQSLMCITLNTETFDSIAATNMVNYPYIYDSYISTNLEAAIPLFAEWIGGGKSSLTNMTNTFASVGGTTYTQFAKSKAWGKDLYEDFVAPTLDRGLHVETWRLGSGGRMSSFCDSGDDDTWMVHPTAYDVIEVDDVTMPDGATWTGTQDHSKWVSTINDGTNESAYICIGDINRMCSQESRGGGTVCVGGGDSLWQSFDDSITGVEDCWEYNPCTGSSTKCYWCPAPAPSIAPTPYPTSVTGHPTGTPYSLIVGDIAIILFNSDNPDMFSAVALYEIPAGTELKFTDDGWTGTEFRGGEGIISFTATLTIPAGYMWTYAGSASTDPYGSWASVSGSFSLSTDSDQIFVYVGEEASPAFVFGLSMTPWVTDGTDIGTIDSVCPDSLKDTASVSFPTVDNGAYYGTREGTKAELLESICDPNEWHTSDSGYFSPNTTLFTVYVVSDAPSPAPPPSGSSDNSDSSFGPFNEMEFFGIIVAAAVVLAVTGVYLGWKYWWTRKQPMASREDRDSIVQISDAVA